MPSEAPQDAIVLLAGACVGAIGKKFPSDGIHLRLPAAEVSADQSTPVADPGDDEGVLLPLALPIVHAPGTLLVSLELVGLSQIGGALLDPGRGEAAPERALGLGRGQASQRDIYLLAVTVTHAGYAADPESEAR